MRLGGQRERESVRDAMDQAIIGLLEQVLWPAVTLILVGGVGSSTCGVRFAGYYSAAYTTSSVSTRSLSTPMKRYCVIERT